MVHILIYAITELIVVIRRTYIHMGGITVYRPYYSTITSCLQVIHDIIMYKSLHTHEILNDHHMNSEYFCHFIDNITKNVSFFFV